MVWSESLHRRTQRIGIGDRSTSSWLNVVITPQFGLQSEVFLMVRSVRHSPPLYNQLLWLHLRQCSQIAVTTAISRNLADPSLLKFSRWDIIMWPWRRQPGNSELPSPQLCDQLAAQLADHCRTPEELPHFQTIPYLLAILYIIPILWSYMMWTKSLYNGVYFGKYTIPTRGGSISRWNLGEKTGKFVREKWGKCEGK